MRDTLLFAALPYAALALLALVPVVRSLAAPPGAAPEAPAASLWRTPALWRWGLGLVLAGHLGGFLLPHQVVALHRLPGGSLLVEAAAFGAGLLALVGLLAFLRAAFAPAPAGETAADSLAGTLLWTLLAMAVVSGLATALLYRWGSSWSAVTIVPYLRSLLHLRPEVALVAELPPLVRLHALAGIAAAGVLPFTRWGAGAARRLLRLWSWPRPWRAAPPVQRSTTPR